MKYITSIHVVCNTYITVSNQKQNNLVTHVKSVATRVYPNMCLKLN